MPSVDESVPGENGLKAIGIQDPRLDELEESGLVLRPSARISLIVVMTWAIFMRAIGHAANGSRDSPQATPGDLLVTAARLALRAGLIAPTAPSTGPLIAGVFAGDVLNL